MKTQANVVIQTAFLGDLILSIPMLCRLRKLDPGKKIVIICKKGLGEYFLKEGIVDYVFEVTKGDRKSYSDLKIKLERSFEIINLFCIHRSVRSQLFSAQLKAQQKIGFNSFFGFWIFDEVVNYESDWPEAIRQWNILKPVDQKSSEMLLTKDWSYLNKKNEKEQLPEVPIFFSFPRIKSSFSEDKAIAIFPGSVWATKKWTEPGFAEVGKRLQALGYKIYLMGGPNERDLTSRIAAQIPNAVNLAGELSLSASIYFIKNCELVIANDSAPTHMAASHEIPVVSLFGPTTLDLGFRPWSNNSTVVENNNLSCRPCGRHGHDQCPLGHHKCMIDLSVERVFRAALKLIQKNREH